MGEMYCDCNHYTITMIIIILTINLRMLLECRGKLFHLRLLHSIKQAIGSQLSGVSLRIMKINQTERYTTYDCNYLLVLVYNCAGVG